MPDTDTQGVALEPKGLKAALNAANELVCGGGAPVRDFVAGIIRAYLSAAPGITKLERDDLRAQVERLERENETYRTAFDGIEPAAQEGREAAGRAPEKVEGGYLYKWVDADGERHQFVHPSPYLAAATPTPPQPAAQPANPAQVMDAMVARQPELMRALEAIDGEGPCKEPRDDWSSSDLDEAFEEGKVRGRWEMAIIARAALLAAKAGEDGRHG